MLSTTGIAQAGFTVGDHQLLWSQGKMGAGGFVTGIDIHPSGSPMLVRTDVGGAYRWDEASGQWIQLVTTYRLPEGALGFFEYDGVASLVSAPTDPNRLYLAFCDRLYFSHDQGESWIMSETSRQRRITMDANARVGRLQGERLAVDPRNAEVVLYGSNQDGLWMTLDGGATWNQFPAEVIPFGEPAGSAQNRRRQFFPGIGNVHFDPSSPAMNGRSSRILVTVWGVGLFETRNGGNDWHQIGKEFNLTAIESASIAKDGTYLLGQVEDVQSAFIYRNNRLEELSLPRRSRWSEVVIHPNDSNILFLFSGGVMNRHVHQRSTDGGRTWEGIAHVHLVAEDIPWLAKESFFSTGAIVVDPQKPDRLWIAQGVGVWYSDNAFTDRDLRWHSRSAGIEELVVNHIVVPAANQPLIANWDRPVFKIEDLTQYPTTWGPTEEFGSAWDLALMASNPQFVVGIFQGQTNNPHAGVGLSGFSEDGGRTWTPFAFETFPFDVNDPHVWVFGNIAVSSQNPDVMIWSTVGDAGRFLYSHDRGANWHDATFADNIAGGTWNRASWFYKQIVVADPINGNTFYAYNWTNKTLYRSTDAGVTFDPVGRVPSESGDFHCKLRVAPHRAGHLFFTPGFNNHNLSSNDMGPLFESRDGGATWEVVQPTLKIIDIAFGAPAPGSSLPTYYVNGQLDGPNGPEWGIFWSLDEGKHWEKISGIYPMGISKGMSSLAADPEVFGRIYIGTGGIGFFFSTLADR